MVERHDRNEPWDYSTLADAYDELYEKFHNAVQDNIDLQIKLGEEITRQKRGWPSFPDSMDGPSQADKFGY